ncbi:MAG: DUF4249 domain-containing protein [Sphingobacteriales bacterium]
MKNYALLFILIVLVWCSCYRAYQPKPLKNNANYLVVDAQIGADTGFYGSPIRLSRTVPLNSNYSQPEIGAKVVLQTDKGSIDCEEIYDGYFLAPRMDTLSGNFGLVITTTDGKVYKSDVVPAKNSPPVDSLYYKIENGGVRIYADTHDASNTSRYYEWDYTDQYEVYSTNGPCYNSDPFVEPVFRNSAGLSKDVLYSNSIAFIKSNSEKLFNHYSMTVTQRALTADAYKYFQELDRNSMEIGGIFGKQPSTRLTGNIHCVSDPSTLAIGYLLVGRRSTATLDIYNRDLPAWEIDLPPGCRMNPPVDCGCGTVIWGAEDRSPADLRYGISSLFSPAGFSKAHEITGKK